MTEERAHLEAGPWRLSAGVDIELSPELLLRYPGILVGFQRVTGVENPPHHPELELRKTEAEVELRTRFASCDRPRLREIHPLDLYHRHFRSFGTGYPVQHQLESVVHKGRAIPSVAALVEAVFVAELRNLLLTAGHDLALLRPPLRLEVASGGERFDRINGQSVSLKTGDIYLADQESIVGSVLYGPDRRTALSGSTEDLLLVVYAVPGIGPQEVENHLAEIVEFVRLVSPHAEAERPLLLGS